MSGEEPMKTEDVHKLVGAEAEAFWSRVEPELTNQIRRQKKRAALIGVQSNDSR